MTTTVRRSQRAALCVVVQACISIHSIVGQVAGNTKTKAFYVLLHIRSHMLCHAADAPAPLAAVAYDCAPNHNGLMAN